MKLNPLLVCFLRNPVKSLLRSIFYGIGPREFLRMHVLIYLFTAGHSHAQITDGLVAKFSFNSGNLKNEAGPGLAKAYGVDLTEDRFGNPNFAYYMQGNKNSYITLGTEKYLKPVKGSISVWVNMHGIMGSGMGVASSPFVYTRSNKSGDCNEAYYLGMNLDTRKLNSATNNNDTNIAHAYSHKPMKMARWYHLAMTYDNEFLCFYVDGELQYKTPKNFQNKFLEGDSVLVGMRKDNKNVRYMLGCVDDIQIFNRVLHPSEIKQLYEAPDPRPFKVILRRALYGLCVVAFILLIVLVIKWRVGIALKKEKEKNMLLNKAFEQEIKVLTAQMNPHFIFNFLNTIQQFIITNNNEKAQIYLTKFSRLMRKILESNTRQSITLKEEVEIFEKYLEIESLRFNNVFTYNISLDPSLEPESIHIPHFLLQPIIENAVWHGLLPKEGEKALSISFSKKSQTSLICTIDDNGVGRKGPPKPLQEFPEKRSLALNFIEQRLQLLSKIRKEEYSMEIFDKKNANNNNIGTKVILTIPILNN